MQTLRSTETVVNHVLALCLVPAIALCATLPLAASEGFIYGKVETKSGQTYEGRLRWDGEESSWGDHFNGSKHDLKYMEEIPDAKRRTRKPIKIFGYTLAVTWEDHHAGGRQFVTRFGDIRRIEPGRYTRLTMNSGTIYELSGGSNDIGADIEVFDPSLGEIDIKWRNIEFIEFAAGPATYAEAPKRIYGTVITESGDFTGFVQWDQDETLWTDKLDGETRDGDVSIEFGRLKSIERRTRGSSQVTLKDGRELVLDDSNDVDSGNRGIFVDDPRFGRVLVSWDAFERFDLREPPNSGPSYSDFTPSRQLRGQVTASGGKVHRGRIVFDLDESETWEILHGDTDDIEYHIRFADITSIMPAGRDSSEVVLKNGERLELEDSADVGSGNAGVLVISGDDQVYIAWDEVEKVELH